MSAAEEILGKALRGKYPFEIDAMIRSFFAEILLAEIPEIITSCRQAVEIVEVMIADLESKLDNTM